VGYFVPITIGTPGKQFNILIDSGSADFWVPSESCSAAQCGKHEQLGPDSSSTFVSNNATFQITYGTGGVSGTLCQDSLSFAGLNLTDHVFGVTTAESTEFSSDRVPFDGLMGLAQSILSDQATSTPIEALKTAGAVKVAQTGYALGRVADETNIGQITFGGVDKSKFTGSLTLIDNVSQTGFWEGDMDAVSVDGKSVNLTGRSAILDTGTTLLIVPEADAAAIHAAIPGAQSNGQGSFALPCTTNATVGLTFGGKTFTIDPRDLAFFPLDENDLTGECTSGISSGNIGGARQWLIGDVFLKSVYLSTNVDTNQIGLAPIRAG